ncbi:unnamed protein product, partial [Mesorhabditis spiculigera]
MPTPPISFNIQDAEATIRAVKATHSQATVSPRVWNSIETSHPAIEKPICSEKYLFADFHASKFGGGVGNFMFEWISFIGIANVSSRHPALHLQNSMVEIMLKWQKSFPNIFLPITIKSMRNEVTVDIPYQGCCKYTDVGPIFSKVAADVNVFVRLVYMQSFYYFRHLGREEVRRLVAFHPNDFNLAKTQMVAAKFNLDSSHNVCVHVRRGDFVKSTLHQHSTEEFTTAAIRFGVDYARQNTNLTVAAVLLGNDLSWEKDIVKSVVGVDYAIHVAAQHKDWVPHIDWVFSQLYCDTVVLTAASSTYGWWLAYLARGSTVLYNGQFSKKDGVEKELDPVQFWPEDWRRIRQNGTEIYLDL